MIYPDDRFSAHCVMTSETRNLLGLLGLSLDDEVEEAALKVTLAKINHAFDVYVECGKPVEQKVSD